MTNQHVRDSIADAMKAVLVGPLAADETLPSKPADTYVTGILWPRDSALAEIEDDGAPDSAVGDEAAEHTIPGYRAVRPCSLGITCTVLRDARVVVRLHGTARYVAALRPAPEIHEHEDTLRAAAGDEADNNERQNAPHNEATVSSRRNASTEAADLDDVETEYQKYLWKRVPLNYHIEIDPADARVQWRAQEFLTENGDTVLDAGVAVDIKRRIASDRVTLTVTVINVAKKEVDPALWDQASLFQARVEVSAEVSGNPAILARAHTFSSDEEDEQVNQLLYRSAKEYAVGHGVAAEWPDPTMDFVPWVATAWMPSVAVAGTDPNGHRSLDSLRARSPNPFAAATLSRSEDREASCLALRDFVALYDAWIQNTLDTSVSEISSELLSAATLNIDRCKLTKERLERGVEVLRTSNAAWRAFTLANAAMDKQSMFPAKGARARPLIWRPFQLAFMLLVIPSVVYPREEIDARRTMDLLWFPTGGGKTEAYLALTAFAIFFRRLTQDLRRDTPGVDVLMRYTMRLLTIQQFQRAAALITACELMRQEDPTVLGSARITIGLYAGSDATPNRIEDAAAKIAEELSGGQPTSTPRQLLECPVCGAVLPVSAYSIPQGKKEMRIVCGAPQCDARGMPLPIMTVDDVMYAEPPSLLIGVADKFAQLPRRSDIRRIFGLDSDLRPDLIIQDELHLISGPLGSMAGLYESAIDLLCTADGVPPKVIGSTATIGRAAHQVRALFDRDVLQFPPPGFDAADSFFAVRDDIGDNRRYVGIASAGRSPKFALQATLAAASQTVYSLLASGDITEHQADPYWTCVAYFNSLRELGGAHVLVMDDVPRQMQFIASRLGSKVRRYEDYAKELSGRASSREIPGRLLELNQSLGGDDPYAPTPVDVVLASNMISVGVDVPRLGLMVVNGQPKSTAEYIQASSRVGRGLPGLIVTLYNFGRPRDLSHFEHFQTYHQALYRSVEATSVTPWAPRARDKGLHAVFAALVRNLATGLLGDKDASRFDASDTQVLQIAEFLLRRAASATDDMESSATKEDLAEIIKTWGRRSEEARASGSALNYWEKIAPFGKTAPALMFSAEGGLRKGGSGWATPNSLREVEPSTAFIWKQILRTTEKSDGTN